MNRARICRFAFLTVLAWPFPASAQTVFPLWRGSNTLDYGVWLDSPIAAIGDIENIHPYGSQAVHDLPYPMAPDVHTLYWCEGIFRAVAVVKGTLRASSKRYLWASAQPGCELWDDNPKLIYHRFKTRVWLLREEGSVLRPTYDGGSRRFIGFFTPWDLRTSLSPRQQLGAMFLTPSANSDTLDDYADYLWWGAGDIACDLLGKPECVRRIRALSESQNSALHESACHFLTGELGVPCLP